MLKYHNIEGTMKTFQEFQLKDSTFEFIQENHFSMPTEIQEKVISKVLKKKDVIGISSTGTGKTHAYLIPIFDQIDTSVSQVQAVITAPTRELAYQIYDRALVMKKVNPELVIKLYVGGKDRNKDLEQLSTTQPHLVIGTPGRINDLFLEEGGLRLDTANCLVVDEADMTLEYGFLDEIDSFAGRMKDDLQMLVFSATIPDQLKPFLKKYMHHPLTIHVEQDEHFHPNIKHVLVPCYHHSYEETILSFLPGFQPFVCLIFANTKLEAERIAKALKDNGVEVLELHGNLESRKRKQAMKRFMANEYTYVVATDLAARGIDNDAITHVISCGFPEDNKFYIHRSGRTARAGQDGICYALYHQEDDAKIQSLMKQGVSFQHQRYRKDGWQTLTPYGKSPRRKKEYASKEIAKIVTKKNEKVKPGYKKKKKAEIQKIEQQKRREMIRAKIREEKKARYQKNARKESK